MTEMPRSYTERRNLIAQKLEPYFHVSNLLPRTPVNRPKRPTRTRFPSNGHVSTCLSSITSGA